MGVFSWFRRRGTAQDGGSGAVTVAEPEQAAATVPAARTAGEDEVGTAETAVAANGPGTGAGADTDEATAGA